MTWGKVAQLDAGSHFSPKYAGEGIPTLAQILGLINGETATLFLEAKNPSHYPDMEEQIANTLNDSESGSHVVVLSFDHDWITDFQENTPTTRVGLICWWKGNMPQSSKTVVVDVFWGAVIADPSLIIRAHHSGLEVVVWTVNSPWLMKLMLRLGVDGITTDYPDRWARLRLAK